MQPLSPSINNQKTDTLYRFSEKLPVGLFIRCLKESADLLDLTLPAYEADGLVLTFINYKGDLQIAIGDRKDHLQQVSPGLGLLSAGNQSLHFRSASPVVFSAAILFIPRDWVDLFMKDNPNFIKIEQVLAKEENIITCRLGRRQLSLFAAMINHKGKETTTSSIYRTML